MIAPAAELRFGLRPLPSTDVDRLLQAFREFANPQAAEFTETFRGPSLPAGRIADASGESRKVTIPYAARSEACLLYTSPSPRD